MVERATIYRALATAGLTMEDLGRQHGVNAANLRRALTRPYPRYNRIIAAFFRRELHELWPEWYRADGSRRSRHGPAHFEAIVRRVEAGEKLDAILDKSGLPQWRALSAYRLRHPDYDERLLRAMGRRGAPKAWTTVSEDRKNAAVAALRAGGTITGLARSKIMNVSTFRRLRRIDPEFAARTEGLFRPRRLSADERARRRQEHWRTCNRRRTLSRRRDIDTVVEKAVSKHYPPQMRTDIKNDLALALLAGRIRFRDAKAEAAKLATAYNRMFGRRDHRKDEDRGGYTLADRIVAPG